MGKLDAGEKRPSWMGPKYRPAVVFECVGVPGILDDIMENVAHAARIIIVGVCMQTDHFHPVYGINKELQLQFVVAYSRREFTASLRHIAEGQLNVAPLITDQIALNQVPEAFDTLSSPDQHAKIIVHPNVTD